MNQWLELAGVIALYVGFALAAMVVVGWLFR